MYARQHLNMILVLTAATYRVAAARSLPPINYFTTLDHYTLGNAILIVLCAVWSRVQVESSHRLPL